MRKAAGPFFVVLVFAYMRVDVQRDLGTKSRQIGESRHADGDVVAHAGRFDDGLVGMLGQQFSAQMGNHAQAIVAAQSLPRSLDAG